MFLVSNSDFAALISCIAAIYAFICTCSPARFSSYSLKWEDWSPSRKKKLGELMELIKSGAKALKMGRSPINKLTMQMVKEPSKSPKLKVKAAESRHLLPIVRHILERYFPQDTEHKRLRYDCIVALDDMYKEMRKPVGVFQGPTASMLGRRHLILYRELVKEAIESRGHQQQGWLLWKWYPKHHLFSHLEKEICLSGNPAHNWCYADESAIGDAVHIAETCHASTLHRLVIEKHRI